VIRPGVITRLMTRMFVDAAGYAVRLAGPSIFQWEAVLLDAPQRGSEVGHDFLAADDKDHVTSA